MSRFDTLIGEFDADTGQTLAEYIRLDNTLFAFVQSERTYHVHVDQIGTPKALTDSTGTTAWEASITSQGKSKGAIQSDARIIRS